MLYLVYSRVNQAWFGMWNESVLRVFVCKVEANEWLQEMTGGTR